MCECGFMYGSPSIRVTISLTLAHVIPQLFRAFFRRIVVLNDAVALMLDAFEHLKVAYKPLCRLLRDLLSGPSGLPTSQNQPSEANLFIRFDIDNFVRSFSFVMLFEIRDAGRINDIEITGFYLMYGCAILESVVLRIPGAVFRFRKVFFGNEDMCVIEVPSGRSRCIGSDFYTPVLLTYEVDNRILSASTFSYD